MNHQLFLFCLFFAFNIQSGQQLTCCNKVKELFHTDLRIGEQDVESPCTNLGTNCCSSLEEDNKCLEDNNSKDKDETKCNDVKNCGDEPYWLCRILYTEIAFTDKIPTKDNQDVHVERIFPVHQECFNNSEKEVEHAPSCDFIHKIFYVTPIKRVTLEKDCYCNTDRCNANITIACQKANPDLKCGSKSLGGGATIILCAIGLTLFTSLPNV